MYTPHCNVVTQAKLAQAYLPYIHTTHIYTGEEKEKEKTSLTYYYHHYKSHIIFIFSSIPFSFPFSSVWMELDAWEGEMEGEM